MPRYPQSHRQSQGQKKRTPPAKQPASRSAHPQASRHTTSASRPQSSRTPVRSQSPKKPPVKKQPVKQPPKQQTQRRYSSLLFYLWIALAFPELVLHLSTAKSGELLFNSGLLLGAVFAALPAAVMFFLCTSLSKGLNRLLTVLYSALAFLFCASQLVYYRIFGTFYTFFSMTNGAAAFQFGATIFSAVTKNLLTLVLMALPLLTMLLGGCRRYYFRRRRPLAPKIAVLLAAIALHIAAVSALPMLGGTDDTSAYGLYHNASDAYLGVNRLGLFTAFRLDMMRTITGSGAEGSIDLGEPTPVETEPPEEHQFLTPEEPVGTQPQATEPAVPATTAPPETTTPAITFDTSPNVLSIDFDSLIAAEDNQTVKEVHQYFAARTPSNKNEKTGMFEGCNLILITAEAFSHLAVSEELTPTLYMMMNEGFRFTNYYVPDWGVSTTDGEYAHLTGTIPKDGVWSFKRSADNLMPLTMNQQLLKLGYNSYAYHGHTYTYYSRDKYLTNLGYSYKGLGNGLEVKKTWPESDVEVVDLSTADFVGSEPFSVYYMSISGHREFTFGGNAIAAKNKDHVADLPYSANVRAYLATQLELEWSMGLLLQRLEEAGVLQNTVIVLTADHYPNGLTPEEIGELLGHTPEGNFEIYRNGAFIWKSGMTPETIDEPSSHLDLLPTLSNLFGLEFDSRLYMGRDVFSDAPPLVMFRNRSWITDVAQYNSQTRKAEFYGAAGTDDAYVKAINSEVGNRFAVSTRILENDYWRILFAE